MFFELHNDDIWWTKPDQGHVTVTCEQYCVVEGNIVEKISKRTKSTYKLLQIVFILCLLFL